MILFVRNFTRVGSQIWPDPSVRNSVWGPFSRNLRGVPSLFWLGGGGSRGTNIVNRIVVNQLAFPKHISCSRVFSSLHSTSVTQEFLPRYFLCSMGAAVKCGLIGPDQPRKGLNVVWRGSNQPWNCPIFQGRFPAPVFPESMGSSQMSPPSPSLFVEQETSYSYQGHRDHVIFLTKRSQSYLWQFWE